MPSLSEVHLKLTCSIAVLPEIGYLRVSQIVGCPKKGIPAIIPVSRATWWAGVKSGRYPEGVLLSPGVRAWRVEDIRELVESLGVAACATHPLSRQSVRRFAQERHLGLVYWRCED